MLWPPEESESSEPLNPILRHPRTLQGSVFALGLILKAGLDCLRLVVVMAALWGLTVFSWGGFTHFPLHDLGNIAAGMLCCLLAILTFLIFLGWTGLVRIFPGPVLFPSAQMCSFDFAGSHASQTNTHEARRGEEGLFEAKWCQLLVRPLKIRSHTPQINK